MNRYFPLDEYERRWSRVEEEMVRRGFETAVVWGRTASMFDRAADILYLTNYYSTKVGQPYDVSHHKARAYCAAILRRGDTPQLIVDDPGIHTELISTTRVEWHADPVAGVAQALSETKTSGRVAFVGTDFFAMKYWRWLKSNTPSIHWEPADDLVLNVRRRKSVLELECCREAGDISATAMVRLMDGLVAGKTEAEAAAAAAHEIVIRGGIVDRIACTFGDKIEFSCREPLAGYSLEAPGSGDMVKAWLIGPMFQGYYMDPGRTAVTGGNPDSQQRHLIESCVDIVNEIASTICSGSTYKQAADLGDRLIAKFGGAADPNKEKHPFYGHPNGLYFEGPPYVSNHVDHMGAKFHRNDVIGVETFLSLEDVGSAGFEQNYIVHDTGVELITPAPELWH